MTWRRVQAVKDSIDKDLTMSGSATTVRWLLANGLLDELGLLMHPIAVGSVSGCSRTRRPTRCAAVQCGARQRVLHLRYAPAS